MWKWIAIFLALVLVTTEGRAGENSELHALMTGDESRGWRAVGRLNMGRGAFCTGSLIADDLVLTAGHCMYDGDTGRRFAPEDVTFLADWRAGRASAYRGVRQIVVHPEFAAAGEASAARASHDLALLQLDQPIRKSSIIPFATGSWPRKGATVAVVSYGENRDASPSLQEACKVLARRVGALILSCVADFGSSGAPVFAIDEDTIKVVSVISAKAQAAGRPVSIGTGLEKQLSELMAMIDTGAGRVAPGPGPRVVRLGQDSSGSATGAKFLRP